MRLFLTTTVLMLMNTVILAQETPSAYWKTEYSKSKSFIENQGQFDLQETSSTGKIRYAVDFGATRIFFGEKGISYNFLEATKVPKEEREKYKSLPVNTPQEYKAKERLIGKFKFKTDEIGMSWEGSNSAVELIGLNQTSDYHNYTSKNKSGTYSYYTEVKAFEKIVYKNIYPFIDVEYIVHPEIGIKYALTVHPGADFSNIKMVFDTDISLIDGKIHMPTIFGDIIDHEPITFYEKDQNAIISSKFIQHGKRISFEIGEYTRNETIVIDPWTQTPAFPTNWDCVWEVERDGSGNIYILGGIMPMQVLKYNPTGTLQWTYNTPYDTSNVWLGTFATDLIGNTYVTAGSTAQIQKIGPGGGPGTLWNNTSPGGIISSAEFWNISFNCDQTKLVIGGTGGAILALDARIYNVDVNTGNISAQQQVSIGPMFSFPPNLEEVRSITAAPNGKYYFLTHDTIGYINSNINLCPINSTSFVKTSHGVNFGYKCENYRYDNSGIMAIRADANFVYVHTGTQLQKRSLSTLAIIATVTIPGGQFNTGFGGGSVSNSGIDIDNCGNIYVGSTTGVYKFNASLVQQGSLLPTPFKVYDVVVNSAGEIVAVGGTGDYNSSNRSGGVQSFSAAGACLPLTTTCCDATICIPQDVCIGDAPFALTTTTNGGTWSGAGVNASGIFNPSTAGAGTHLITYSLSCGSETISISVNTCTNLSVCVETNGALTASNGTAPYAWQNSSTTAGPCVSGIASTCGFFLVPGPTITTWTTFATGTTITPPANFPIQVIDNTGNAITFTTLAAIPACTGTIPCPTITVNTNTQSSVLCFGGNTGSANVNATGGTGGYTYTWLPGNLTGPTQSNLSAGSYIVNVLDANACPGATTVIINQPNAPISASTTSTPTACGTNTGTATVTPSGGTSPYTYNWSPIGGTANTALNLAANTYTVTVSDGNGCQTTSITTISSNNGPTVTLESSTDIICFGGNNGAATVSVSGGTSPYTYNWSPLGGTTASAINLSAGTFSCTVTDAANCVAVLSIALTEAAQITIEETIIPVNCGTLDGQISTIVSGGTGAYSYTWSINAATTSYISNLAAGNYTLIVEDQNNCTVTASYILPAQGSLPVLAQPTSGTIIQGESISLIASGASSYIWSPSVSLSCEDCTNPIASPTTTTTYTVTGTDISGCIGTAEVTIFVTTICGEVFVPSVFSPNGLGPTENNTLCVIGNCIAELNYSIYNRWGERVFETTDLNICWDGYHKDKPLNTGVYAYKLIATLFDGTNIEESGNLTLVR